MGTAFNAEYPVELHTHGAAMRSYSHCVVTLELDACIAVIASTRRDIC